MNKFKTILIDDQPEQLELLSKLLSDYPEIDVQAKLADPVSATQKIQEIKPDLIFLDVEMPVKDGFDILDELSSLNINPQVIFVTSFDHFAIRAFEYAAFDYIQKPVDPRRLQYTISRLENNNPNKFKEKSGLLLDALNKLIFRNLSGYVIIDPKEILFIEAQGNYSTFHLGSNKKETVTSSIGEIEKQLDPAVFFKTHRSVIINLQYIERINYSKHTCTLSKNDQTCECKITKAKIPELVSYLK